MTSFFNLRPFSALLLPIIGALPGLTHACTTFASTGNANADGGLLIAKNRDSLAAYQSVEVRQSTTGNRYIGLFYHSHKRKPYPYIAAGVNQHGLAVVQNESASINNASHFNDDDQSAAIYTILENYRSVAEVRKAKQTLFADGLANFLIIGDKHEAILVEVGPDKGSYQTLSAKQNGNKLYHTNHYVLKGMEHFNKVFYPDSQHRFTSIKSQMNEAPSQLTMAGSYYNWVNSAKNGPNDSILRNVTLASWVTRITDNGASELWVRVASPNHKYQHYQLTLDQAFWNNPPSEIGPVPLSAEGIVSYPVGSEDQYEYQGGEL
ncbi:carcinine hydrolase/isopenicillin-N N-acyltransferase family protein [Kistimonas asteriae]|uniref:carcinine hydrolase/isopenicillin-N N-acyltransferase family protein n=1 Tax=Kistimonas asteriae TaxID=517724 RepID=UPI001BAB0E85|nr:carcinine hydrolase/isopenicillin-N N-acyltransferase family protein [Kistimonas asteriae]